MTDLDARLRSRLSRLEAAVPIGAWSGVPSSAPASPVRPPARRRRLVVLLAAAFLLVASAAAAQRVTYPDVPEPELEAAIAHIWAGRECVAPAQAREAVQGQLDRLGYADWTVASESGIEEATCAAAAVLVTLHEVRLMPGIGTDIERAKDVIAQGLLDTCMGRAEAIQFVGSVLTTAGSDPFSVRADPWGPQGAPIDQWDEYRAHVAAGCFVYVGMPTRDAEGRAIHDLWGPWP